MIAIAFESPDQPDVLALLAALDAYLYALFPAEVVYALDASALARPNVLFAVARDAAGSALGCCALVLDAEAGEIKRMYVRPERRGLGVARRLLAALENAAQARGCRRFRLETGTAMPAALALYQGLGYERCGRFGDYPDDPYSIFMHKPAAPKLDSLIELRDLIRQFSAARDWQRFHTPKNLAMALSVEVAELLEHFQWLPTGADAELDERKREGIRHELADVLVYLIQLADQTGVDLRDAVLDKMVLNAQKYPLPAADGGARG